MVRIVNNRGTARPSSRILVAGAVRRDVNGARIRRHIFHDFRWPSVSGFAKLMLEAGDPRHKDSCHDWPLTLAKLVDQPSIPYSPFIRSRKHVNSFGRASEWSKVVFGHSATSVCSSTTTLGAEHFALERICCNISASVLVLAAVAGSQYDSCRVEVDE